MPTGAAANDSQLLQGRSVYLANCSTCHGAAGSGGAAPALRGDRLERDLPTEAEQVAVVTRGRGAMPAFGARLSRADIEAVVRYVREVLANETG